MCIFMPIFLILITINYQISVISLSTIIHLFIFMKSTPLQVKVEQDQSVPYQALKYNGPFKIQLSQVQQKPQFIPFKAHWTNFQNAKYCAFILLNQSKMQGITHSNLWPLYQQMSLFIQSRNFRQCKTYHQRMLQKFKNIQSIVDHLRETVQNFQYLLQMEKERLNKYLHQNLNPPLTSKQNQVLQAYPYQNLVRFSERMRWVKPLIEDTGKKQAGSTRQVPFYYVAPRYINYQFLRRQNDWIECHQLFMAWSNCLLQLKQMNPSF